jgi:hypothetical protein
MTNRLRFLCPLVFGLLLAANQPLLAEVAFPELVTLTAPVPECAARFGHALALDGDTLVVGERDRRDTCQPPFPSCVRGAAYVYQRDANGAWQMVKDLTPPQLDDGHGQFGSSVALEGDVAVVAAPVWPVCGGQPCSGYGGVFIYERNLGGPDNWGLAKVLPATASAGSSEHGSSVSLSSGRLAVGAPQASGLAPVSGAVYLFERDAGGPGNWGEVAKLEPDPTHFGAEFGKAVSLDGDILAVGSPGAFDADPKEPECYSGAGYVFERSVAGVWERKARVLATHAVCFKQFGRNAHVNGHRVAFGGTWFGNDYEQVDLYERDLGGPSAWGHRVEATSDLFPLASGFGASPTLAGERLFVGALRGRTATDRSGTVRVFDRRVGGSEQWPQVAVFGPSKPQGEQAFGAEIQAAGRLLAVSSPLAGEPKPNGDPCRWGSVTILDASQLFTDGFETGDLSGWSQVVPSS